jgi:hypothetical protein
MFLMPLELIESAIADAPDPIADLAGVSVIAKKLHVSVRALIDQLYNVTLMTDAQRDELLPSDQGDSS